MKEYVITLHNFDDLDGFYEDMETPGGNLYIPDRVVDVAHKRPVSRNTNYMLTEEEAEKISQDPRVLAVDLTREARGVRLVPHWSESGNVWNKSNSVASTYKNWGLLRCVEGVQRTGWGLDTQLNTVSGTINVTASGKYVDIVIVDGHLNPDHPEFSVNIDGTGGSRVTQYNWFSLNPQVTGGVSTNYSYTPYVSASTKITSDNDHGTHVAGIACGNTQGWAHDANIYNINPYTTNENYLLDYIKIWHRNKPINSVTGIKNPTITNHSYGSSYSFPITFLSQVRYRGTTYSGPFTSNQLTNWGINNSGGATDTPTSDPAFTADYIDLMAEGVIVIGSAGNSANKIAVPNSSTTDDYNNYYMITGYSTLIWYNRGCDTAAPGAICVGGIGSSSDDSKITYSNCGPRVDVYAPGRHIMSSVNTTTGIVVSDTRNTTFKLTKKSGTSQAAPQVTGIVACLAESTPRISQSDALKYIQSTAKIGQIFSFNLGITDPTDLQGSVNRYLYFYKQRLDDGFVGPKVNSGARPDTGQTWPRTKIFRYGS
jgi:hypothetical protein